MNNILAASALRSHLSEISDGAYKTATEIAIETLYKDALRDWEKFYYNEMPARTYLGLTKGEFDYWILGVRDDTCDCKQEIKETVEYWSTSPSNRLQRTKNVSSILNKI